MKITFHAFLSPSVLLDLKEDRIAVVFGGPFDDWNNKGHILSQCEAKVYVSVLSIQCLDDLQFTYMYLYCPL